MRDMIISIDTEKAFDQTDHPFLMKTFHLVRIPGTNLNSHKTHLQKTQRECPLHWENPRAFNLRSGTQQCVHPQRCPSAQ